MNVRLTPWIAMTVAAVVGFVHGWLNGAAIALAGREAYGLVGITGAVFVVDALVLGLVVSLRVPMTSLAGPGPAPAPAPSLRQLAVGRLCGARRSLSGRRLQQAESTRSSGS